MAYLSVPKISRHLIFLHLSSPFIVDNCSYISILSFAITYPRHFNLPLLTVTQDSLLAVGQTLPDRHSTC